MQKVSMQRFWYRRYELSPLDCCDQTAQGKTSMKHSIEFGSNWRVEQSLFSSKETMSITGAPQALLRLWRKRGYLPQNTQGGWPKHNATELATVYILYSLSRLGVGPSDVAEFLDDLVSDLLFFAITSGEGAVGFSGPASETKKLRDAYEDTLDIARQIACPRDERRFVLADRGGPISRCADLSTLVEQERFEYFYCIDLVAAARGLAERAQRPLLTLSFRFDVGDETKVRRLSRVRGAI